MYKAICEIYEDYEGTLKYIKTLDIGSISDNTREVYDNKIR